MFGGLFANLVPTITYQGKPCKVEGIDFNDGFAILTLRFPNEQRFKLRVEIGAISAVDD